MPALPGSDLLIYCVLLVDDEPMIVMAAGAQLKELGRTVCGHAATAAEAIRQAEIHRPALVLMDMHLEGDGDGVDAALAIRERVGSTVIFMTSSTDAVTLKRIETAKPSAVLFKPVSTPVLKAAIEDALFDGRDVEADAPVTNDPPTGLVARAALERMIGETVKRPSDQASTIAILVLDIHNLAELRTAGGRGRVENLLQLMAYRLSNFASPNGRAARLAEGRFAMFCWFREGEGPALQALLRREVTRPYRLAGRELNPECAIGVATYPLATLESNGDSTEIGRQLILLTEEAVARDGAHGGR